MPSSQSLELHNRPDEWRIEQGLSAAEIPILDQTGDEVRYIHPPATQTPQDVTAGDPGDHETLFKRTRIGWKGYVEWETEPEKKAQAHKILTSRPFPPNPEYQMGPIPGRNPMLDGITWKMWHRAIGGELSSAPEDSWKTVLEEKHSQMLHILQFPYNGEPPKRLVTAKVITPNDLHFVRNHGGIPRIDENVYKLQVDGMVTEPKSFTLEELKRFPHIKKLATLQCSGTRRIEQIGQYPGQGDEVAQAPWAEGAIGNAEYTGISLKKVMKQCGMHGKHVELYGADTYFKLKQAQNYVVSVPWSKVRANEVLLVWEMNGKPLPAIHGSPLRVIVLGYIGARSVKWLYRIKAIDSPSLAPVQSKEYLYFNQQTGKHNQKPTDGIQIQEMPVSSAIMSPWTRQVVIHNGTIHCKGWAYSGGGRWPERVEVSADGGFSWYPVPLENLSPKHKWTWRTWAIDLPCDVEGWIEIVVRCWDNSLNTQPLHVRAAWNWGLHVTSSAHRIQVYSINKTRKRTAEQLQRFEQHDSPLAPLTRPEEFTNQSENEYKEFWAKYGPRDVDD